MAGLGIGVQKSTPEKVDVWNPQQTALFGQLVKQLQSGMQGEVAAYPGQMYVPQTPQEQAYFDYVNQNQAARQAAVDQISSGTVPYEIGPEWAEKYYAQGIKAPALTEYKDITLPGIKEAYAGPGYWGSARAGATAKSAEDLATSLAAQKASLMYGEELASRSAQEAALARQAQYGPAAAAGEANILGTAGQYARSIEQEKTLADLQRWYSGETIGGVTPTQYSPYLQLIFQALGLTPTAVGQRSTGINVSGAVES